jgi:hypothetical protein
MNDKLYRAHEALRRAEERYVELVEKVLAGDTTAKEDLESAARHTIETFEEFMRVGNVKTRP